MVKSKEEGKDNSRGGSFAPEARARCDLDGDPITDASAPSKKKKTN